MTTRCHSVFSLRSPVALSRQLSDVATLRFAIGRPSWVRRISGSLPRFPTRITLFTLPAIAALPSRNYCEITVRPDAKRLARERAGPSKRPYTLAAFATPACPDLVHTYSNETS